MIVVDEAMEAGSYKASAAGSRYERFWRPRAESRSTSAMWYFETIDSEAAEQGEKWPTDLVR